MLTPNKNAFDFCTMIFVCPRTCFLLIFVDPGFLVSLFTEKLINFTKAGPADALIASESVPDLPRRFLEQIAPNRN